MFSLGIVIVLSAVTTDASVVDPDKVVRCVREEVTGKLTGGHRVCHTVGEWRSINRDSNDEARRIIQPGTTNDQNG